MPEPSNLSETILQPLRVHLLTKTITRATVVVVSLLLATCAVTSDGGGNVSLSWEVGERE